MTIEDYRVDLGWSLAELARRANIDVNTLKRAIAGQQVFKHTAGAIANAISQGVGHKITYQELDGLNVID